MVYMMNKTVNGMTTELVTVVDDFDGTIVKYRFMVRDETRTVIDLAESESLGSIKRWVKRNGYSLKNATRTVAYVDSRSSSFYH